MNHISNLRGVHTAMVTPFTDDNKVDYGALEESIGRQIDARVDGLLFLGTTGEAPTLSPKERKEIIGWGLKFNHIASIMVGTGSNDTKEAVRLTKEAADLGADYALVSTPEYNKPSQEGIYQHFAQVALHGGLPIVVYNVPSRTGVNIQPETLERIAELDHIAGVKEASGNMGQIMDVLYRFRDKDFAVLSGDDSLTLPMLSYGGQGVVSVVSNLLPAEMVKLIEEWDAHDKAGARIMHTHLYPAMKASFLEGNPASVKTMMELAGYCSGDCRLPMTRPSDANRDKLREVVAGYGLLHK